MAVNRSTLKVGQRIFIEGFTGTAGSRDLEGAVRVEDQNDANTHYVSLARLAKGRPFENGMIYIDADNTLFAYSSDDPFTEGTWLSYTPEDGPDETDRFGYDYPTRPLRLFTVNPEIAE